LDAGQIARYARQIALPELGPAGQRAICGARVLIVGGDLAAETARAYLAAAGVGAIETRARAGGDVAAWLDALAGVDLVVRTGDLDGDALLDAAARLGVPVVIARAEPGGADLVSIGQGPASEASSNLPPPGGQAVLEAVARPARGGAHGAGGVLAGALAAAEALVSLVPDSPRPPRRLRLPVDGGDPIAQEIPRR
jgi:hypothetical protein